MQNSEAMIDRIRKNLSSAIVTMRAALDDAERRAKDEDVSLAIQNVSHAFTWGYANSFSSIQNAMAALRDLNAIQYDELQQELEAVEQNLRDRT